VDTELRSPELTAFLQDLGRLENPAGLTIRRFHTAEELARYVQEDVMRRLTTVFRNSRQQPLTPHAWNVPYRSNPFFTGRESVLEALHQRLSSTKATALMPHC
jgi:hypothetical protein